MKTLSVIIPCYNEEKTIAEVVRHVQAVPLGEVTKEVILIDDCSSDRTLEIAKTLPDVVVVTHTHNQGKGAAVISGMRHASGDLWIIQDADLEYSPDDYPDLLAPILNGDADVVYGSRFLGDKPHRVFNFHHYLANRLITFLSNIFTNLNLSDIEVGYKVFSKKIGHAILPRLSAKRFGIEVELTARVARQKCRVYEVSISYHGRTYEEGKKITWKDGLAALWFILWFNVFKR